MTETTVSFLCPNCGAGLEFDAEKQKFACEFCLSEFEKSELEGSDSSEKAEKQASEGEEYCNHMNEYFCQSCGAEVVADEHTAADFCTFCHNPVVLKGKLSGQLKPDRIIPFAFDKKEAEKRFLDYAKSKKFVPDDFKSQTHAEMIRGIYYPFWVTDADTKCNAYGTAKKIRTWSTGNYRYTETSSYSIERSADIHFEDIVSAALKQENTAKDGVPYDIDSADKNMLEGILPYPSDALIEFSMPYLSGFNAKKRNIERKELTDEVRTRMNSYANTLLRSSVNGYASVDMSNAGVTVMHSSWEYALMPIWHLTYKDKKGKIYTFAMNGNTGKLYGELPISFAKLGIFFASLTGALTVILTIIGRLFF